MTEKEDRRSVSPGTCHEITISDEEALRMTKIPSKCDRCGVDFPSMRALQAHKAKEHSNKPPGPGPALKQKDKEAAAKTPKSGGTVARTQTPGSALMMNKWINGETRSTAIGRVIQQSKSEGPSAGAAAAGPFSPPPPPARQDTPMSGIEEGPNTPELRTVELDQSINLLASEEAALDEITASPMLNTLRVFPPNLVATPSGSSLSSSWTVSQMKKVSPEPEKSKRGRAKYDDEIDGQGKKTDHRITPEAVRLAERTPRNLNNDLVQVEDTQEVMEIEFDSVEVSTEEWDAAMAVTARADSTAQQQHQYVTPGAMREDLLSESEVDWFNNDTIGEIPPSPSSQNTQDTQGTQDTRVATPDADRGYEIIQQKDGMIERLRSQLEDALSLKEEYWQKIRELEEKDERLEAENARMTEALRNEEARMNRFKADARAHLTFSENQLNEVRDEEARRAREEIDDLKAAVTARDAHIKEVREHAKSIIEKAKNHVQSANSRAEEKDKATDAKKRAEIERLKAINTRTLDELKKVKVAGNLVTELKTSLAKVEGQRDLEKVKADKANEVANKLEDIVKEAQELKVRNEKRIDDLEHANRVLARKQPCGIIDCNQSCGREHHCGTGPGRNRSRNRRQQVRGVSESDIPTVANLADRAGTSTNNMQQVVNTVSQNQVIPHPRVQSLNRGMQGKAKPWTVIPCPDFFRNLLCPRGQKCRNAHELKGARDVAESQRNPPPQQQQHQQPQQPQGGYINNPNAGRSQRKLPAPAYHPDHPHYNMVQNMMSGNANGQVMGAPSVPMQAPQVPQLPQLLPRATAQPQPQGTARVNQPGSQPRTFSEVASGAVRARQTVSESLSQQASSRNQLLAVQNDNWREELDAIFAFPESPASAGSGRASAATPTTPTTPSTPGGMPRGLGQ